MCYFLFYYLGNEKSILRGNNANGDPTVLHKIPLICSKPDNRCCTSSEHYSGFIIYI